jgi:hypothetical protein
MVGDLALQPKATYYRQGFMRKPIGCFLLVILLGGAGGSSAQPGSLLTLCGLSADDVGKLGWSFDSVQRSGDCLLLRRGSAMQVDFDSLVVNLQEAGYWFAAVDSSDGVIVAGPRMAWIRVELPDVPEMARVFRGRGYRRIPADGWRQFLQEVVKGAAEVGYPFARIRLRAVSADLDGEARGILEVDLRQRIVWKGVRINGNLGIRPAYLEHYLGIRPGNIYRHESVLEFDTRLDRLPFGRQTGKPVILFEGNEATANVFLDQRRAGNLDFLIGLMPKPEGVGSILTGQLNAGFRNTLRRGDLFSVIFERLQPQMQRLEVSAAVPCLGSTAYGAGGALHIYRRDSSWVDVQMDLGVEVLFPGGHTFRVFTELRSSTLAEPDTQWVKQSRMLPSSLDFRQQGLGVVFGWTLLDHKLNPRVGWDMQSKLVASYHAVRVNPILAELQIEGEPTFDFGDLYTGLTGNQYRFRGNLSAFRFQPVGSIFTVKMGLMAGAVFSERAVYRNEQFRLGGNRRLRGFNEEALFATRYAIATAEWRLLLGGNAYLAAFGDWGYLENINVERREFIRPLGLGLGLHLATATGMFGISMAVGRADVGVVPDWRGARIHLGYVGLL